MKGHWHCLFPKEVQHVPHIRRCISFIDTRFLKISQFAKDINIIHISMNRDTVLPPTYKIIHVNILT